MRYATGQETDGDWQNGALVTETTETDAAADDNAASTDN